MYRDVYIFDFSFETGKPPPGITPEIIETYNDEVKVAIAKKIAMQIIGKVDIQVTLTESGIKYTGRLGVIPPEDLDEIMNQKEYLP